MVNESCGFSVTESTYISADLSYQKVCNSLTRDNFFAKSQKENHDGIIHKESLAAYSRNSLIFVRK